MENKQVKQSCKDSEVDVIHSKSLNIANSIKQKFGHLDDVNIQEIDRDNMRSMPDFNP